MRTVEEPTGISRLETELVKYHIVRRIGRGGFGEVYRAKKRETGQPVAIKVYDGKSSQEAGFEEFMQYLVFPREIFNHPGLVRTLDAGHVDGAPYTVMEWADGPCMEDLIKNHRLTWAHVKHTFSQLLRTLDHLNAHGIVHGDVSPANIVGQKLVDYDAMRFDPHYSMKVIGSPGYMAPEEMVGFKTHTTDVYHACAILYDALFGRLPDTIHDPTRANEPGAILRQLTKRTNISIPPNAPLQDRVLWQAIFENGMKADPFERLDAKSLRYAIRLAIDKEIAAGSHIIVPQYGSIAA